MGDLSALALVALGLATSFAWVIAAVRYGRGIGRLELFEAQDPPEPDAWPRVSVIIPARDEATTLEAALASLLAQDYPQLEVVLVDDRSEDATGALMDTLAARDPRVHVSHVDALPDGWLGKVHALSRGVDAARGDWLLLTDADVHFAPGLLRRAVALTLDRGLDHLSIAPDIRSRSALVQSAMTAFHFAIFALVDTARLDDPKSDAAIGIGAFNLVRRAAYERTPGFEWLRLEIADDFGLALMLKRAGAKSGLVLARRALRVEWYPSVGALVRGLEKNGFANLGHYRLWLALVRFVGNLVLLFGPLGVFAGEHWALFALAPLVAYGASGLALERLTRRVVWPRWSAWAWPAGSLLLLFAVARSVVRAARHGGVEWRATLYPTKVLRAGQRVKL